MLLREEREREKDGQKRGIYRRAEPLVGGQVAALAYRSGRIAGPAPAQTSRMPSSTLSLCTSLGLVWKLVTGP
jgi:hypothetical protein